MVASSATMLPQRLSLRPGVDVREQRVRALADGHDHGVDLDVVLGALRSAPGGGGRRRRARRAPSLDLHAGHAAPRRCRRSRPAPTASGSRCPPPRRARAPRGGPATRRGCAGRGRSTSSAPSRLAVRRQSMATLPQPTTATRAPDDHRRVVVGEVVGLHEVDAGQELVGGVARRCSSRPGCPGSRAGRRRCRGRRRRSRTPRTARRRWRSCRPRSCSGARRPCCSRSSISLCDDLLGQAELGDAVDQHAARLVQRLEDGHLVAARARSAAQARPAGPGADDGDPVPGRRRQLRHGAPSPVRALPVGRRSARAGRWRPACPCLPTTQTTSHWSSCGQTRPQIAGRVLVSLMIASAPVEVAPAGSRR